MAESKVKNKSRLFAIRIVRLYKYLVDDKKEFVMSKQVLRSGTSISANLAEAECAQSRKDFFAKHYIAYKECSETLQWLELLKESGFINEKQFDSIYADCKEIIRMLAAITKRSKDEVVSNCYLLTATC